jgi:hypothetical protein
VITSPQFKWRLAATLIKLSASRPPRRRREMRRKAKNLLLLMQWQVTHPEDPRAAYPGGPIRVGSHAPRGL